MGHRPPPPRSPLVRDVRVEAAAAYGCHGSRGPVGRGARSQLWGGAWEPTQVPGQGGTRVRLGAEGDGGIEGDA